MASQDDNPRKDESAQNTGASVPRKVNPRRNFLMVAMTLGAVFVTAGIGSVAKSLFAPSTAPPAAPPATGSTKTVTKTVTSTVQGATTGASSATTTKQRKTRETYEE